MAAIAAELMGSRTVRLYHDHVLVKEPGTRQRTPWHQDQPYYNVDGRQNASMWLPVDPVPRASTLELVAGSHRGEWYMPRTFLDDQAKWFPDGTLAELPDIDGRPDDFTILGWELEPGDAVFFHMLTLHAAGGVPGPHRRGCCRCASSATTSSTRPRPWTTSPPFPGLADELPAGAPMDHPLFPVLWSATRAKVPSRDRADRLRRAAGRRPAGDEGLLRRRLRLVASPTTDRSTRRSRTPGSTAASTATRRPARRRS